VTASQSGFQPRNTPAERRAFFDVQRKIDAIPVGVSQADFDAALVTIDADIDAALTAAKAYADTLAVPVAGTITPTANWIVPTGFLHSLFKVGKIVVLNIALRNNTGATTAANPQIATIPAGFRPGNLVRVGSPIGTATAGGLQVSAAGAVQAVHAGVAANNDVCGTLTYQQVN
jgi:hypothetical protein